VAENLQRVLDILWRKISGKVPDDVLCSIRTAFVAIWRLRIPFAVVHTFLSFTDPTRGVTPSIVEETGHV